MADNRLTGISPTMVVALGGFLVGLAFVAAALMAESDTLSLSPPPTPSDPSPAPDVASDNTIVLYQSAYTAWAALILTLPAMMLVWVRRQTTKTWRAWRLFWTVGYAAFVIHMLWSMGVFFEGDIERMTTSSRVSAFWPGIVFLVWWGVDTVLAWINAEDRSWVALQRAYLHGGAFILFVGGSLVQGETLTIKLLGALFVLATLYGAVQWIRSRRSLRDRA